MNDSHVVLAIVEEAIAQAIRLIGTFRIEGVDIPVRRIEVPNEGYNQENNETDGNGNKVNRSFGLTG
jgi:hypothetical protein